MNLDDLDLEQLQTAGDSFWDTLYQLRLKGTLCDIELTVHSHDNTVIIIPAHKLVLVGASTYFQAALERDDLLDVYNFDGINALDLQMVLDYIYHQKTWEELVAQPEAAVAANVLGIKHRESKQSPPKLFRSKQGKNFLVVPVEPTREKKKAVPLRPGAGTRSTAQRVLVDDVDECFQKSIAYSKGELPENEKKLEQDLSEIPSTSMMNTSSSLSVEVSQAAAMSGTINLSTPSSQPPGSFVMLQNILQTSAVTTDHQQVQGFEAQHQDTQSQLALIADASVSMETLENTAAASSISENIQSSQAHITQGVDDQGNIVYVLKSADAQPNGEETQLQFMQTDDEGNTNLIMTDYQVQENIQQTEQITYQAEEAEPMVETQEESETVPPQADAEYVQKESEIAAEESVQERVTRTSAHKSQAATEPATNDIRRTTRSKQTEAPQSVPAKVVPRGRGRPRKDTTNLAVNVKGAAVEVSRESSDQGTKASTAGAETPSRYGTRRKTFTLPEALRPSSSKKIKLEKDDEHQYHSDVPISGNEEEDGHTKVEKKDLKGKRKNLRQSPRAENVSTQDDHANGQEAKEQEEDKEGEEEEAEENDFPNIIIKEETPDEETDECEEMLDDEVPQTPEVTQESYQQVYYHCNKCNRRFKSQAGLAIHEGWSHGDDGNDDAEQACTECGGKFKGLSALGVHMRRIHKKSQLHKCNQEGCSEEFSHIRDFRKHLVDMHNITSFYCEICDISFRSPEGLKIHMIKKHTDLDSSHMCELCGKCFKMKHELSRHVNITHATEKYKCHLCERAFKSRSSLKRHIRTFHSDQRNCQCDVCPSTFKTMTDMKKHRALHFREVNPLRSDRARRSATDEVLRPCKYCGKHFSRKCNLEHHESRVHESKEKGLTYFCSICHKSFSVQAYLQQHILAKHRPRRFKCASCGASFTQRYMLNRHLPRCKCIPKHLKPFRCSVCGASFLNKRNLQLHSEQPDRCQKYLERSKGEMDPVDYVIYMNSEEGVGGGEVPVGEGASTVEDNIDEGEGEEQAETSSQSQFYQIVEDAESGQTRLIQIGDEVLQVQELPDDAPVILQTVENGNILQENISQVEGSIENMVTANGGGDMHMSDDKGVVLHIVESGDGNVVTEFGDGSQHIVTQQIQVPYEDQS